MLADPNGSLNITEQAEEKSGLGFDQAQTYTVSLTVASQIDIFRKKVRDEPDVGRLFVNGNSEGEKGFSTNNLI